MKIVKFFLCYLTMIDVYESRIINPNLQYLLQERSEFKHQRPIYQKLLKNLKYKKEPIFENKTTRFTNKKLNDLEKTVSSAEFKKSSDFWRRISKKKITKNILHNRLVKNPLQNYIRIQKFANRLKDKQNIKRNNEQAHRIASIIKRLNLMKPERNLKQKERKLMTMPRINLDSYDIGVLQNQLQDIQKRQFQLTNFQPQDPKYDYKYWNDQRDYVQASITWDVSEYDPKMDLNYLIYLLKTLRTCLQSTFQLSKQNKGNKLNLNFYQVFMDYMPGCPTVLMANLQVIDKLIQFMESLKYELIFSNFNMVKMEKYVPYFKTTGNTLEDRNVANFDTLFEAMRISKGRGFNFDNYQIYYKMKVYQIQNFLKYHQEQIDSFYFYFNYLRSPKVQSVFCHFNSLILQFTKFNEKLRIWNFEKQEQLKLQEQDLQIKNKTNIENQIWRKDQDDLFQKAKNTYKTVAQAASIFKHSVQRNSQNSVKNLVKFFDMGGTHKFKTAEQFLQQQDDGLISSNRKYNKTKKEKEEKEKMEENMDIDEVYKTLQTNLALLVQIQENSEQNLLSQNEGISADDQERQNKILKYVNKLQNQILKMQNKDQNNDKEENQDEDQNEENKDDSVLSLITREPVEEKQIDQVKKEDKKQDKKIDEKEQESEDGFGGMFELDDKDEDGQDHTKNEKIINDHQENKDEKIEDQNTEDQKKDNVENKKSEISQEENENDEQQKNLEEVVQQRKDQKDIGDQSQDEFDDQEAINIKDTTDQNDKKDGDIENIDQNKNTTDQNDKKQIQEINQNKKVDLKDQSDLEDKNEFGRNDTKDIKDSDETNDVEDLDDDISKEEENQQEKEVKKRIDDKAKNKGKEKIKNSIDNSDELWSSLSEESEDKKQENVQKIKKNQFKNQGKQKHTANNNHKDQTKKDGKNDTKFERKEDPKSQKPQKENQTMKKAHEHKPTSNISEGNIEKQEKIKLNQNIKSKKNKQEKSEESEEDIIKIEEEIERRKQQQPILIHHKKSKTRINSHSTFMNCHKIHNLRRKLQCLSKK